MKFEWDEEKNRCNINKHGISFQTAAKVFTDPCRLEFEDDLHSNNREQRNIVIGRIHKIIFVVYTDRNASVRLISARKATKTEEKLYYDNLL